MGILKKLGLKRESARERAKRLRPLLPEFEWKKRWPRSLAEDHVGPIVTFGISLRASTTSTDWPRFGRLLQATLHSVFRQTDNRFRVLICGHDAPDIPELSDPRVEYIAARWEPPSQDPRKYETDKNRKRFVMGLRLRSLGGGFYMQLDSDDLLHRDLVAFAMNSGANGCVVQKGYALDSYNQLVAPVPGAWSVDIDRVCGSTAIVDYRPEDIASTLPEDATHRAKFSEDKNHAYIRSTNDEYGRTLAPVPFGAVIYVINTADNLSFATMRAGVRGAGLLNNIREHRITDRKTLAEIDDAFGTRLVSAER